MSSLSVFPPPPAEGEITLCELNARLIAESSKTAELSKYVPATQGIKYPSINMKTESVKTGNSLLRPSDQEWNTMIQKEEGVYKKLLNVWHSRGFSEMLLEIKKNKDEGVFTNSYRIYVTYSLGPSRSPMPNRVRSGCKIRHDMLKA